MRILNVPTLLLMILAYGVASPSWAQARSAAADVTAIVGIQDGPARLLRQTGRFLLAEGLHLQSQDIIETAAGGFAQLELPKGDLLGIGENTQLMLAPPGPAQVFLLRGWLKITAPDHKGPPWVVHLPEVALSMSTGALVVHREARQGWQVFVESGSARLQARVGAQAAQTLGTGQYASGKPDGKWQREARPDAAFIGTVPRPFLDPLPARAQLYAERKVVAKSVGELNYQDAEPWLTADPSLRQPLLMRWRSRLSDSSFRAALAANLGEHPEWERVIYPERFCPGSERRRSPDPASCQ